MTSQRYRRFIWCGVILAVVMTVGTIGYWIIGDGKHSVLDALYMTYITIATIGYGEIVDMSNDPAGRVFTMLISVSGIGVLAYAVTSMSAVLVEGELTDSFRRRKMENKARQSRRHYIVCGIGSIGENVVAELTATKRDFVVVESSETRVAEFTANYRNAVVIKGDATCDDVLTKAGIAGAAGLFAVTGDDNQNLVISLTARHLNPSLKIVAKCDDVASGDKMKRAGADAVVSPSFIGGLRLASEMLRPTVVSFLDVMLRDVDKNLRVEEISLNERFACKTVADLEIGSLEHTLLLAIKETQGWVYNPRGTHVIGPGSTIVVMTTVDDRQELQLRLQ